MDKNISEPRDTNLSLEDMYNKIIGDSSLQLLDISSYGNNHDRYKQYSVCDLSKYETVLSSNIIIKK